MRLDYLAHATDPRGYMARSTRATKRQSEVVDIAETPPPGLRCETFSVGDDELVLMTFDVGEGDLAGLPRSGLTPTEVDLCTRVLEGQSNAEIAKARGRSIRTVAVQLSGLFKKFGVHSRAELAMVIHGRHTGG